MYGLADHCAATLQLYVYMCRLHFTSASMRDYAALTLLSLPLALLEVCQVVVRISVVRCFKSDSTVIEWTNWPVRLRDQPKHSELIASYVKKVHWPTTQALCSSCCAYYLYFYRLALDSPSNVSVIGNSCNSFRMYGFADHRAVTLQRYVCAKANKTWLVTRVCLSCRQHATTIRMLGR